MFSYPSSLLIIVSSLLSFSSLYGDEQIRRAQEELRKRHLFFGETTGQASPALTAALGHYQKKKGFACTGRLDPETCGSLGISHSVLETPRSLPVVLIDPGEARGANGEALPRSPALRALNEDRTTQFDRTLTDRDHVVLSLLGSDYQSIQPEVSASRLRSRSRSHRVAPPKTTNPFVMAFRSVDRTMKRLLGDAGPTKKKNVAAKRL
jgi:hypothetical protein